MSHARRRVLKPAPARPELDALFNQRGIPVYSRFGEAGTKAASSGEAGKVQEMADEHDVPPYDGAAEPDYAPSKFREHAAYLVCALFVSLGVALITEAAGPAIRAFLVFTAFYAMIRVALYILEPFFRRY